MRVGIVGAGITGLALTHYLADRDVDSVAYEARPDPGGVIRSRTVEGVTLEYGPQRFRLTDAVADLTDAAGLTDDLVTAPADLPLYVYADDRLRRAPLSLSAFLRSDLLSITGKLRLLAEPLTDPIAPTESAAAAFRRKFGDEAYENLIGPLYGGTYASDPAEMPAEHALEGVMALEAREGSLLRPALRRILDRGDSAAPVTISGGNQRLATGLAETYADRVFLDTPVEAIHEADDGYRLDLPDGTTRVDTVVLTTPAPTAADLLAKVADGVDGLRTLTYNPLAFVYLRTDYDRPGLGYQVRRSEPLSTLGVTWNGAAFGRDGLVTCFLGGMTDPDILAEDDDTLGTTAATEFETVTGSPAEVIDVTRHEDAIPAYDDTWDALADLSLPPDVHLATNYTARVGVPGRIRQASRLAESFGTS
ncbi:MAG: protoporphyrinogen oxidase [Halobacteriaceae archaeon]